MASPKRPRACQSCGHRCVAGITAKCWNAFGIRWPGGNVQKGKVPPHNLLGLRENGADAGHVNISYCLMCGQIQGEWPVEAGVSYLIKYAEKKLWEVVVCVPPVQTANYEEKRPWYYLYFFAKTKEQVEEHVMKSVDNFERFFVSEIAEMPGAVDLEELEG